MSFFEMAGSAWRNVPAMDHFFARLAVLAALATLGAGCSDESLGTSASGSGGSGGSGGTSSSSGGSGGSGGEGGSGGSGGSGAGGSPAPLVDEVGFIDIEPIKYKIWNSSETNESAAARLWYVFQAADEDPDDKPLAVFFNGGPGTTTGLLFGFNTAKRTLDPPVTLGAASAPNPASWSSFANLLYIDPASSGFSYNVLPGATPAERDAMFSSENFNPSVDASQMVRAVLRFLATKPQLLDNQVVLVGESYGGIRATMMLRELLDAAGGDDSFYADKAFVDEVEAHFHAAFGEDVPVGKGLVGIQFGAQVLIQPLMAAQCQVDELPLLLNQPGSRLFQLADELGTTFVPCTAPCTTNSALQAMSTFLTSVDRGSYDITMSDLELDERLAAGLSALTRPADLEAVIGTDPRSIPGFVARERKDAVKVRSDDFASSTDVLIDDSELIDAFGALAPQDRYFLVSNHSVAFAFPSQQDPSGIFGDVFPLIFLANLPYVETMITDARDDIIYSSAPIPSCFAKLTDYVDSVELEAGGFRVHFPPPAPGAPPSSQFITVPVLQGGHTASMRAGPELRDAVQAWLAARAAR